MAKKTLLFLFILFSIFGSITAREKISSDTEFMIRDYYRLNMELNTLSSQEEKLALIDDYKIKCEQALKNAVDYEQEAAILSNLRAVEIYTVLFDDESRRDEIDNLEKEEMKKGLEIIDSLEEGKRAYPMLYTATAETLSRYMFSSVTAVLKYGFRTKKLWEKTLEIDGGNVLAAVDLGQWYYFAPFFFGGSSRKAKKLFESAWKNARTPGEKYYAGIYLSQFYFEKKNYDDCRKILNEVEELCPTSLEIANIKYQNSQKRSLFKYNRDRSKLDEKRADMSDEDLKKGAAEE